MGRDKAALVNADPPYGVDYAGLVDGRERSGVPQKKGGWGHL